MTRNIIQLQRAARVRQFKRTVILSAFVTILAGLVLGEECFAQTQDNIRPISDLFGVLELTDSRDVSRPPLECPSVNLFSATCMHTPKFAFIF